MLGAVMQRDPNCGKSQMEKEGFHAARYRCFSRFAPDTLKRLGPSILVASYRVEQISGTVYMLRLNDDRVKYFEANWYIPEGITYNSYVIKTREGGVLIDLWKSNYSHEFMEALERVLDPADLRYVVINHAEPDHTGSLPTLAARNSELEVAGFPIAEGILRAKYDFKNKFRPLRNEEELELGGAKLKFYYSPWIHWPETMLTYYLNERILFTCDALGSYSIPDSSFADEVSDDYAKYSEKYLVTVIGSYRENLLKALDRIGSIEPKPSVIAPSHGAVWRKDPERVVNLYRRWASGQSEGKKLVIVYASMYGSVKQVVDDIVSNLGSQYPVEMFAFSDAGRPQIEDVLTSINGAKVLLLASPTYETGAHPEINHVLELASTKLKGLKKPAVLLTSYAWGSTADKKNLKLLQDAGFDVIDQATFKEKPDAQTMVRIVESLKKALDQPRGSRLDGFHELPRWLVAGWSAFALIAG